MDPINVEKEGHSFHGRSDEIVVVSGIYHKKLSRDTVIFKLAADSPVELRHCRCFFATEC